MTEYRVVVKKSTSGRKTVSFWSDWMSHRDLAVELLSEFKPFENKYGEWFEGYIETKEALQR